MPQHQAIPSGQPLSPYDPHQFGAASPSNSSDASGRTLWIGEIESWMDETYITGMFGHMGFVVQVKIIRDKNTGASAGYGFVEFTDGQIARTVLETLNGKPMPDRHGKLFRLNWSSHSALSSGASKNDLNELSLFVGDLAQEVNDFTLLKTFSDRYPSVRGARVIMDPLTGNSRRYGFVRFGDEDELNRAISEMQGQLCCNRPMRINKAATKRSETGSYPSTTLNTSEDATNTTIFLGGLDQSVGEDQLKSIFQVFGEITVIKMFSGKGWAFITFSQHQSAERAILEKNGSIIGANRVKVSWGKGAKTSNTLQHSFPMAGPHFQYPPHYFPQHPAFFPTGGPVPGFSPYGFPPHPGSAPTSFPYGIPPPGSMPPHPAAHHPSAIHGHHLPPPPHHIPPFDVDGANQQYLKQWNRNMAQSFDPTTFSNPTDPSQPPPFLSPI